MINFIKKAFLVLHVAGISLLSLFGAIPLSLVKNETSGVFQACLLFCFSHQLKIVIVSVLIIGIYTLLPRLILPAISKRLLQKKIMDLMFSDIFEGDRCKHRITLFREVCYPSALWFHFCNCAIHFFRTPLKPSRYLQWLAISSYLHVDRRVGSFANSSTMFRVEENEQKKCEGVAGFIRFRRAGVLMSDLPDISGIKLKDKKHLHDLRGRQRELVADYMGKGFIRDFSMLQQLNHRANRLYGTIVEARGRPWGVLLADALCDENPFDEINRRRFDAYAQILSATIDMG